MAQKWYQKATVQAAIAGGIFVVLAAIVTGLFSIRKESANRIVGRSPIDTTILNKEGLLDTAILNQGGQLSFSVTFPSNGAEIREPEVRVRGTASIPPNNHIWVFSRRANIDVDWIPHTEATMNRNTNEWGATVYLENAIYVGQEIEIAVLVVQTEIHRTLLKFNSGANWPAMRLPHIEENRVKVFKIHRIK